MEDFLFLILGVAYAGLNALAFGAFAMDKHRAKTNLWRIPEATLPVFAAIGPLGALAAMILLRHKTRHTKFLLVPVFAVLHILCAIYLFTLIFR